MYTAAIVITVMSLTSCYSILFDWEVIPQTEIVQIPQEGGTYDFKGFEKEQVGTTRMYDPGKINVCMRYRLIVGEDIGEVVHDDYLYIEFEVPANQSGIERNVTLEISKAKNFHLSEDGKSKVCDQTDLSDENWEEWQTVWRGVQEC